ncbi:MAG TPA: TOMM precursor leader peptide-binding protein [Mycobacteriales bacterium]|nr:TOMM precursor leader peptide-binding protein [Mycobacteriales bacterium]
MRPVINPALRILWRSASSVQLGVDPRHRLVLEGLTPHGETVLGLLDGTRDVDGVVTAAAALGVSPADAEALIALLLHHGALEDAAIAASLPARARDRLLGELAELSLVAAPGGAASALDARRRATVLLVGCGRLGTAVAALLAAGGVGRLLLRDEHDVLPSDVAPGVAFDGVLGLPRAVAAARVASGAGEIDADAAVRRPTPADCTEADLAVVAGDLHAAADAPLVALLAGVGIPWLLTGVRETVGVVGPLVRPGRTACPRCLDLARADRDPTWPAVAAQLAAARDRRAESGSAALVTMVAALAAAEAMSMIGGPHPPQCYDATLEVRAPDWSVRRRAWQPHPSCRCVTDQDAIAG